MLNICVQADARTVRRLLEGMEVTVCGGIDACQGEWVSDWMDRWLDGQMIGWTDDWMDRWLDGQMIGWTDDWMDRWLDGQISSLMCAEMNCWGTSTNICAILGYYSACSGNSLPTFRDNLLVPYSRVKRSKKSAEFDYIAAEALNHATTTQSINEK